MFSSSYSLNLPVPNFPISLAWGNGEFGTASYRESVAYRVEDLFGKHLLLSKNRREFLDTDTIYDVHNVLLSDLKCICEKYQLDYSSFKLGEDSTSLEYLVHDYDTRIPVASLDYVLKNYEPFFKELLCFIVQQTRINTFIDALDCQKDYLEEAFEDDELQVGSISYELEEYKKTVKDFLKFKDQIYCGDSVVAVTKEELLEKAKTLPDEQKEVIAFINATDFIGDLSLLTSSEGFSMAETFLVDINREDNVVSYSYLHDIHERIMCTDGGDFCLAIDFSEEAAMSPEESLKYIESFVKELEVFTKYFIHFFCK